MNRQLNKNLWWQIAPLCFCFASAPTISADDPPLFELSLESLLQIPVSGATKTPETVESVPAAVTVFERAQLDHLGAQSLYQLLVLVPSFSALRSSDNSTYANMAARGFRSGTASSRVLLVIDGQKVSLPRHGGIASLLELPLFNVERIEFLRGPGAAVYGANAMLGVINITTVADKNRASLQLGRLNEKAASVMANTSIGQMKTDLQLFLSQDDGDAFTLQDVVGQTFSTKDKHRKTYAQWRAQSDNSQIQARYFSTQYHDYLVAGYAAPDNQESEVEYFNVGASHRFEGKHWQSEITGGYTEAEGQYQLQLVPEGFLYPISNPQSEAPAISTLATPSHEWRLVSYTQWQPSDGQNLSATIEWSRIKADGGYLHSNYDYNAIFTGQIPVTYYGDEPAGELLIQPSVLENRAISTQWQTHTGSHIKWTLGIRYDDYYNMDLDHISPRLGAVFTVNPHNTLKLLYGTAFRAPSSGETGFSTSNTVIQGGRNLKPEVVETLNLIWQFHNGRLNTELGYFENRFVDMITEVTVPDTDIRTYANRNSPTIKGLEWEANFKFNSHWNLQATGNYLFEFDTREYLEADSKAALSLVYAANQWTAQVAMMVESERYAVVDPDLDTLETYTSHRYGFAKFQYHLKSGWTAFAILNNLADEQVHFPGVSVDTSDSQSRGLSYAIGVQFENF